MKAEKEFSYQAPELEEAKFGTFFEEGPSFGESDDEGDDMEG